MSEDRQGGSISRTLLLPREHHHRSYGLLGTFRLRHILAEDGCQESQVALAKSLLTAPAETPEERTFYGQLAVYWLLQAAQSGHPDSFSLLKDCASSGIGLNSINSAEVEKCLKYNKENRLARRVAYSIFRAIMSETEDVIPQDVFKDKIDRLFKDQTQEKFTKESDSPPQPPFLSESYQPSLSKKTSDESNITSQPHLSFNDVVSSVQSCLEGNVPLVSLKQVANYEEYKKWLSTKYLRMFWNLILESTEKLCKSFSTLPFPFALFFLMILLSVYAYFSPPGHEKSYFIETAIYFVAVLFFLFSMISTTCFVVHISYGGDTVKKWLSLIKLFQPCVKTHEIENKYLSKTTISFVVFFLVSFVYISLVPLKKYPSILSDIGAVSFILMFLVDRSISQLRYYTNISLILNALACLYKMNVLQGFFEDTLSFLNFNVAYEVFENFYVYVSFISCLTLPFVLPYLYVKMAVSKQKSWHLVLLPHLMSLVWMNLAATHLASTTTSDQVFSMFTWLIILILSHYVGVIVAFIGYFCFKVLISMNCFRFEIFLFCFAFFILYAVSTFLVKKCNISHERKLWSLILSIMVLVTSYQVAKPQNAIAVKTNVDLPWEKYQTFCRQSSWYRTNTVEVQISCLPLKGREISMEGTVIAIDIVQVNNNMEILSGLLPEPLKSLFTCSLGENIDCNSKDISLSEKEKCKVREALDINPCHLHNWDEYKYQITLEISSRTSPEVVLLANHESSSFLRNLKEGDSIKGIGALDSNIGSSSPRFLLHQATCTSCYPEISYNPSAAASLGYKFSLQNIVWFYLSPFIHYESE